MRRRFKNSINSYATRGAGISSRSNFVSTKQDVILASDAPAPAFSFEAMQRMAVAIAKSGLFGVKEADQALSLMMIAQAEGKHPALIARDYDIIQGRPAKKAEAILRDFQASGGKVEWHELSDKLASATFSHPLSVKPLKIDWDIARAKVAGLLKPGGMYEKYPRAMLRSRCVSEGCRAVAPSATSGFYTPEEVNQMETEVADPVPLNAAIEQAAALPTPEQIEATIDSMDVATLPALEAAFAAAWRSTKDAPLRARYKSVYDSMKLAIAEAQARDIAESQPS
jgi:hypothetical protein